MTNRPNFLYIMTDQQRADWLSCAGHSVVKTPNIDAIAAAGVRFQNFHATSPVCMPNRATFMTGRYPTTHGLRYNGCTLSTRANTFVDVLARYVFNAPIPGAYEISELIMGIMIFAALPVVTWRGTHITIDLLDLITPRGIAGWRDSFMFLVSAGFVAVLGWELWDLAQTLASYGDVTEYLRLPIHPTLQVMSILCWLTSAFSVLAALVAAKRAKA
jgi:TRAP-type C4-dicarboxylate transport system permease small subunit